MASEVQVVTMPGMDQVRLGNDVRLLRHRRGWSQTRLGALVGVSRWVVSEIECGRGDRFDMSVIARVVAVLGGYLSVRVLYQGEALDRLRDRAHAGIVDRIVAELVALGWEVATEVSFNIDGERGSIDVLAFQPSTGALLVIEVKSVVPDVGGMLMTLDRKVRLATELARQRGWTPRNVSRVLVIRDDTTSRRRVHVHDATFATAFPARGRAVRSWLRDPVGAVAGLLFLPDAATVCTRRRPSKGTGARGRSPRSTQADPVVTCRPVLQAADRCRLLQTSAADGRGRDATRRLLQTSAASGRPPRS
jgi:transcriptional regulator with XRE-family HTH domain